MNGNEIIGAVTSAGFQPRGRVAVDAPMSRLTWFQVGGPADLLFQPADEEDLGAFLGALPRDIPVTIVGVGSNLLVRDGGIEGVVVRLSAKGFGQLEHDGTGNILAGAAVPDKKLATFALAEGMGGLAFYHGIPGAIGGALRMNAGANGGDTAGVVSSIRAVNRKGELVQLSAREMGYEYRHCAAPADLVFTAGIFRGKPTDREQIQLQMKEVETHRETVQPIREKTGGSTFKNPPENSAWRLVDAAGMRGHRCGDAQMSEMHCNFMINLGRATARDLEMLGETVRRRVYENCGIELNWEIKRLGRFLPGQEVEPAF